MSRQAVVAVPDLISPSYFPAVAAVELGFFAGEGVDARIELLFPVTDTYAALRDGTVDYVAGATHAALYAFPEWEGCSIVCALSKGMYWFLVLRADLGAERGDLDVVRGLRVGAAPGPRDGLRRMLLEAGIDPDEDVTIQPVPGVAGAGASFGIGAAGALAAGLIDGFWANGMGAEIAQQDHVGNVVVDARRGDGPAGSDRYTFAGLVVRAPRTPEDERRAAAGARAIRAAQQALQADPQLARQAAAPHFPARERELIAELVSRDASYYESTVGPSDLDDLQRFAAEIGLLSAPRPYDELVLGV